MAANLICLLSTFISSLVKTFPSRVKSVAMAPVLIIVPGSFAPTEMYTDFVKTVHATNAFEHIKVVPLNSVGRKPAGQSPGTMAGDVTAIVGVAEPLLDSGKEVIMLTHSYGGIPGTQSLEKLSSKARKAAGKTGGIEKVIYLTSVILPVGMASSDITGGVYPDYVDVSEDGYLSFDSAKNAPLCFNDLPADKALAAAKGFSSHSDGSFKEKLTYAGYADPEEIHYLFCTRDEIIPPAGQEGCIGLLKATRGEDKVKVHNIDAGHCPTHSKPEETAQLLKTIALGQ